jgi:hypothetical protein
LLCFCFRGCIFGGRWWNEFWKIYTIALHPTKKNTTFWVRQDEPAEFIEGGQKRDAIGKHAKLAQEVDQRQGQGQRQGAG